MKGIAPQQWKVSQEGLQLRLAPGKNAQGLRALGGVLTIESAGAPTQALEISALPGATPDFGGGPEMNLAVALIFALLGGLILNLMPCVLPILAMKALAIASHSGRETHEARNESLAYGAGAVLIEPNKKYGIMDAVIHSDGSGAKHLHQKAGGSRMPPSAESVAKRLHYVHQEGAAVYKFAVARMADVAVELMERILELSLQF